jgi:hypothetical protein
LRPSNHPGTRLPKSTAPRPLAAFEFRPVGKQPVREESSDFQQKLSWSRSTLVNNNREFWAFSPRFRVPLQPESPPCSRNSLVDSLRPPGPKNPQPPVHQAITARSKVHPRDSEGFGSLQPTNPEGRWSAPSTTPVPMSQMPAFPLPFTSCNLP